MIYLKKQLEKELKIKIRNPKPDDNNLLREYRFFRNK